MTPLVLNYKGYFQEYKKNESAENDKMEIGPGTKSSRLTRR